MRQRNNAAGWLTDDERFLSRSCPMGFAVACSQPNRHTLPRWQPYPHLKVIARELRNLSNRDHPLKRLLVILGRQHGKTMLSSTFYPVWHMATSPEHQVAVVSYVATRAHKIGGQCRDLFEKYAHPIWRKRIDKSTKARQEWKIGRHQGGLIACGIDGRLNGERLDGLILDDLYKDQVQAASATYRDKVWDWLTSTALPCLQPHAWLLAVNTRWHISDVMGRMLAQMDHAGVDLDRITVGTPISKTAFEMPTDAEYVQGDFGNVSDIEEHTKVINFPSIAVEDEYVDGELFRKRGEPLCPQLRDLDYLRDLQRQQGPMVFDAVMQGNPCDVSGQEWSADLFRGQFVERMPDDLAYLVVACDPATGKRPKDRALDYTAIVAQGMRHKKGDIFVDSIMAKTGFTETATNIVKLCKRLPRVPDLIGIESIGFQREFLPVLREAFISEGVRTLVKPIENPIAQKLVRIRQLDPYLHQRKFKWVNNRDNRIGIEQAKGFPHPSVHDDYPDCMEMGTRLLPMVIKLRGV